MFALTRPFDTAVASMIRRLLTQLQQQWAWRLGGLGAVVMISVSAVQYLAQPYIAQADKAWRAEQLATVFPYSLQHPLPKHTVPTLRTEIRPYQLTDNTRAWVLETWTPNGYGGDIVLLFAIDQQQRITAVKVLRHRETPGIGDQFQRSRQDHNWLSQFATHPAKQALSNHQIDLMSGATITSKAIILQLDEALTAWNNTVIDKHDQ